MSANNQSQAGCNKRSARYEASIQLRKKSLIAWIVERGFRCLQILSPGSKLTSRKTDAYIILWIIIGLVLIGISCYSWPTIPSWLVYLLILVPTLRIVDIVQATGNVGIFDQLGKVGSRHEVENIIRSLVLLILNYFELMLWFGLIYLTLNLKDISHFYDAFYFSAVTQLTIGYGDIQPLGVAKAVAGVQAILGWALTLLVLARFVSFLPQINDI